MNYVLVFPHFWGKGWEGGAGRGCGYCLNPGSSGAEREMTNLGQEDLVACISKVHHPVALCKILESLVDLVNNRCEAAAKIQQRGEGRGCQLQDHNVLVTSAPIVANSGGLEMWLFGTHILGHVFRIPNMAVGRMAWRLILVQGDF